MGHLHNHVTSRLGTIKPCYTSGLHILILTYIAKLDLTLNIIYIIISSIVTQFYQKTEHPSVCNIFSPSFIFNHHKID